MLMLTLSQIECTLNAFAVCHTTHTHHNTPHLAGNRKYHTNNEQLLWNRPCALVYRTEQNNNFVQLLQSYRLSKHCRQRCSRLLANNHRSLFRMRFSLSKYRSLSNTPKIACTWLAYANQTYVQCAQRISHHIRLLHCAKDAPKWSVAKPTHTTYAHHIVCYTTHIVVSNTRRPFIYAPR